MIYGSVCSGIEAASEAWAPLGWKAAWFSEIEKFPCAVLKHHHPEVPNLGDMTKLHTSEVFNGSAIDVLVGGTPCQSFSIAGLRKGMDDPRGNLALVFLALLDRKRPQWVVWENVPGVLSSWSDGAERPATAEDYARAGQEDPGAGRRGTVVDQSNDFDTFTSGLAQLGYGVAWRVLDAQHFGVPQRRRRVFVVGYLGDWRRAAAVLFESHGLSGHSAPRREAGKGSSRDVGRSLKASGGFKGAEDHETLIAHTLRGEGFDASEDGTGRGTPLVAVPHEADRSGFMWQSGVGMSTEENMMGTLIKNQTPAVVYDMRGRGDGETVPTLCTDHASRPSDMCPVIFSQGNLARGEGPRPSSDAVPTLQAQAGDQHPCVFTQNSRSEVRHNYIAQTLYNKGIRGEHDASPQERDSVKTLQILREKVGTEAFAEWGSRILNSLQSPEVLRLHMYGSGLRCKADETKPRMDDGALPCAEDLPEGALREMWIGAFRGSPHGRELAQQLSRELGEALSQLPPERTQAAVRRLTPSECEKLQGFLPGHTLVPYNGKMAADGPRYKAIGNSMAVPVMRWIGERIAMVD